ncbi:MAG: hypothetical protein HY000_17070 [Planctomycetes bacterium]|nr:hypothetical protein [Planctomycetota bacterium]
MRSSFLLCATLIAVGVLGPGIARADGLLYQLPEDRSWVRFDVRYTLKREGMEQANQAKLTMASVGKAFEGADECRWIELRVQLNENGTERTLIRKLLIPEKYLKKGESPMEHVVRGWSKQGDQDVQRAEPDDGPWPAFLAGPLQDEKKLDKQLVESKLGALECAGVSGSVQFKAGDRDTKVVFETRLHEKAPFGVVSTRMQFEMKHDGQVQESVDATLKLADFGKDAESALPGYQ